jgi:crossover junction endodeoxyribonuclease RuvC
MGIDPGYDRIGWAVGALTQGRLSVTAYGCIETNRQASRIERYQQLDTDLTQLLTQHQPTEAGVETLFFSKNQTTAMQVAEARGIIMSALFRQQVAIFDYNPMQIKQAVTGTGRADKTAVEKMVRLQLRLPPTAAPKKELDDTLDALAILLTHAASRSLVKRV